MFMNRAFISAIMIIALVSALVSPACAFVNGSMDVFEICSSNGDVQTISVQGEAPSQRSAHKAQPDCAFCFATAHAKPFAADSTTVPLALQASRYIKISVGVIAPRSLALRPYQSRAPPSFV